MAKIKINPLNISALISGIQLERAKLETAADTVARVQSGLDMEIAATGDIESLLASLRSRIQRQTRLLERYEALLRQVNDHFIAADQRISQQAKEVGYLCRQIVAAAGTGAVLAGSALSLKAIANLAFVEKANGLFGKATGLSWALGEIKTPLYHTLLSSGTAGIAGGVKQLTLSPAKTAAGFLGGSAATLALSTMMCGVTKTESKKKQGFFSKIGSAVSSSANWFGNKVSDGADSVADGAKWLGGKIVDGAKASADWASDACDTVKKVANTKPVQYIRDIGSSTLGVAGNTLSFCVDVAKGDFAGAAVETYDLINNFFDGSQDLVAVTMYGIGYGVEAFGGDAGRCYDEAEEYHNMAGLAGQLRYDGMDGVADVIDKLDTGADLYKTATGIGKLLDSWDKISDAESWKEIGEGLFKQSGWKLPSLSKSSDINDTLKYYDDLVSNWKTGYKYVDGLLDEDFWSTVSENTKLGKIVDKGTDLIEAGMDQLNDLLH